MTQISFLVPFDDLLKFMTTDLNILRVHSELQNYIFVKFQLKNNRFTWLFDNFLYVSYNFPVIFCDLSENLYKIKIKDLNFFTFV